MDPIHYFNGKDPLVIAIARTIKTDSTVVKPRQKEYSWGQSNSSNLVDYLSGQNWYPGTKAIMLEILVIFF
jgi:hypothetical protein